MDISTPSNQNPNPEKPPEDIEDGEITDDDEESAPPEPPSAQPTPTLLPTTAGAQPTIPVIKKSHGNASDSDSLGLPSREARELAARDKSSDRDKLSDDKEGRNKKGRNKESRRNKDKERGDKSHKHMTEAERSILHLRKREKMMREREKWEKQTRKELDVVDDDFAKTIEKTLATILNKKEKEAAALSGGEEVPQVQVKVEEKRGKKRKKDDREKERSKGKHRRVAESPRSEIDENEMLNIRSGSPGAEMRLQAQTIPYGPHPEHRRSRSPSRSEESFHSEYSSDDRDERSRRKSNKSRRKKENRDRRRDRDQRRSKRDEQSNKMPLQDSQGVCVFYMQGKCQKNDCPYSHEVSPPMKLELCKFYLMDCCAKGENCSYMHSEFPCKFYHTGLKCTAGDDCKFAHGAPLSEGLKQILFKHIETAPRDILQGFPRLSREEALNLINQSQKKLTEQYGDANSTSAPSFNPPSTQSFGSPATVSGPGMYREDSGTYGGASSDNRDNNDREKEGTKGGIPSLFDISVPVPQELAQGLDFEVKLPKNERNRNKQSRWQQEQESNMSGGFPLKSFTYGTDQDMRINSNGDIDMRTLPAIPVTNSNLGLKPDNSNSSADNVNKKDIDIRSANLMPFTKDIDIRQAALGRFISPSMDVDIRHPPPKVFEENHQNTNDTDDELHIDTGEDKKEGGSKLEAVDMFALPTATKDLLARISANQKDNTISVQGAIQSHSALQQNNYVEDVQNINWYSDDDDDDENRLTIKVEEEESNKRERNDSIESNSVADKDGTNQGQDQGSESLNSSFLYPSQFNTKTADIVGKLGDLSKIDISAEVTKLLTSMSKGRSAPAPSSVTGVAGSPKPEGNFSPSRMTSGTVQDPRMTRQDPRASTQSTPSQENTPSKQDPRLSDPRQRSRQSSSDSQEKPKKPEKMSIYEQGGLDMKKAALAIENDEFKKFQICGTLCRVKCFLTATTYNFSKNEYIDISPQELILLTVPPRCDRLVLRSLRPDVDLRNMALPFKGMQNYTPATEIDASINSHLPIIWKISIVEIPRPDYTGLKLSINDAEKTGDPRLRKIFRLSVDEKDSPASPKASPKQSSGTRVDPRLRKLEDKSQDSPQGAQLSYSQQVTMLQSSQFYQSLTSNQKLLLNQELARCDQSGGSGMSDPVLSNLLGSLNLIPQTHTSQPGPLGPPSHGDVISVLANITKMNPLLQNQPLIGQQGLLGAAPGIPHMPSSVPQGMPQDYPINFDPRNGGLLGNAPPGNYGQFGSVEPPFGGYNDDFYGGYEEQGNMGPQGGNMSHQGGNMGPQGGNMGPQGGNFRSGRGYNNNNRDGRRRGNRDGFRGGRGNRNFKRGGGRDNRGERGDRERDRDGGRGNRGHSPS